MPRLSKMLALAVLSASVLVSGCANWKLLTPVTETKYERIPIPADLLKRHCAETSLAAAETYPELEATAAALWICIQDHNADKARIEALR